MTLLISMFLAVTLSGAGPTVLDAASHHLGTPGKTEWDEFAASPAEGRSLEVRFNAEVNRGEATLSIRQRGVKLPWRVRLNGRDLGGLLMMEEPLVLTLPVPAGALHDGANVVAIASPPGNDDVVVGELTLDPRPVAEALGEAFLDVQVRDADAPLPIPCRITVVDERGALAPSVRAARTRAWPSAQAWPTPPTVRPAWAFLAAATPCTRPAALSMAWPGARSTSQSGPIATVPLAIRREVATPGLAACDTHVHTFTHSGHGDQPFEERVVTLAGEGIELPIATDHNYLTDLRPAAVLAGVADAFTPVIGDEVTTRRGHFNAFSFAPAEPVPGYPDRRLGRADPGHPR